MNNVRDAKDRRVAIWLYAIILLPIIVATGGYLCLDWGSPVLALSLVPGLIIAVVSIAKGDTVPSGDMGPPTC